MSSMTKNDQRGLVSFMITFIMMLVIALIVTGFTQVTNRNRREALDRQLSSQAFYAAESGVNEALKYLRNHPDAGEQTNCSGALVSTPVSLDADSSVKYTCVLIDPTVEDIVTSVNRQQSAVFPLEIVDNSGNARIANKLVFTWTQPQGAPPSNTGCPASAGSFPNAAGYACNYGILRVDLMKIPPSYSGGVAALGAETTAFYFQPVKNVPPAPASVTLGSPKAAILPAYCNAAGTCTLTLSFLPASQSSNYYIRVMTLYKDSERFTLDAFDSGTSLNFVNAQAEIDVTGKAQDVSRRIKARARLSDSGQGLPAGAVQANVCKRFQVMPGGYNDQCP